MLDKTTTTTTTTHSAADPIKAAYAFIQNRGIFPLTKQKLTQLRTLLCRQAPFDTHPAVPRFCELVNGWLSDYARRQAGFGVLEKVMVGRAQWCGE